MYDRWSPCRGAEAVYIMPEVGSGLNLLEPLYHVYTRHRIGRQHLHKEWEKALQQGRDSNEECRGGPDGRRSSPLFSAVLDNDFRLACLLLDHGAQIEKYNPRGLTVLQEAILERHGTIVQLLLDHGANSDTSILCKLLFDPKAPRLASMERIPSCSTFLLGGTSRHLAVVEGLVDTATRLLLRGANPPASTHVGWTPLDIALLNHQRTMVTL